MTIFAIVGQNLVILGVQLHTCELQAWRQAPRMWVAGTAAGRWRLFRHREAPSSNKMAGTAQQQRAAITLKGSTAIIAEFFRKFFPDKPVLVQKAWCSVRGLKCSDIVNARNFCQFPPLSLNPAAHNKFFGRSIYKGKVPLTRGRGAVVVLLRTAASDVHLS